MNIRDVHITVLAENTVSRAHWLAEHGLALLIETPRGTVLFDTGQGLVLAHNMTQFGWGAERVDAVVLSHGHYDHTGGLGGILTRNPRVKVVAHPSVVKERYSCHTGMEPRDIGMPGQVREALAGHEANVRWGDEPGELFPGVWASGFIPRITDYEDVGGPFYLDAGKDRKDLIEDDQALWIETSEGVMLILGCAHAGVVNTLHHVAKCAGVTSFASVMGGLHLGGASATRIQHTAEAFEAFRVVRIYPLHCTGAAAVSELTRLLPGRIHRLQVGETI